MMRSNRVLTRLAAYVLRVEVHGPSMLPTLSPGERLLVHRTKRVRDGDIVVVTDPEEVTRTLIKRVSGVTRDAVFVAGDNRQASRDSTDFGPVAKKLLVGRAWYRYFPHDARQRLRRH